ncbi:hypothetical protein BX265_6142 [Streptomyces sp. TLI_235]|nr:hypothetical protein [Streptomyces sp. TLI_235]PBC71532.1 hypothetical protein BX265_6142 [Streptomyces sp. TLI_235]
MSLTFRQWLDQQHIPPQWHGTVGTLHGPSTLRRLSEPVTEPWDSPATLLAALGPSEDNFHTDLVDDAREHYNRAFRAAIGPRNGPTNGRGITVWTRVIGGHDYLFWARPGRLDTYRLTGGGETPTRIHTHRKEN